MKIFQLKHIFEILEQTPKTLNNLLQNLSEEWILNNEGQDSWSPFDIIGHLIHGEETDWIVRANIILGESKNKKFEPFDRFAQFNRFKDKSIHELLKMFAELRARNIILLKQMEFNKHNLELTGIHPEFGEITFKQLIAAWVVHDLSHINQIARIMSKQYTNEVGPFRKYLSILSN